MVSKVSEAIGLSLIPCNSSNVMAFAHVYKKKWIYILFKSKTLSKKWLYILFKNNVLYRYEGQDYNAFISLLNSESKGKWVNEHLVKPKVKCCKWSVENS